VNVFAFDDGYLRRLVQGDSGTEQHFVEYFGRLIRAKARARINDPHWAEDVCQETFLRVFRKLRSEDGVRNAPALGAFVHAVCRNVLHESGRARARHPQVPEAYPEPSAPERNAEGALLAGERDECVRLVLDELNEKDRRILVAVLIEERDKDELCGEMGVDRNYLRVLMYRARKQFRDRFGDRAAASRKRRAG
jgi:RNA polymerase sigma-70 factor (ECF subfamily)